MSAILKPEEFYFPKLNNAEFAFFAGQICAYVEEGTVEALHAPEETYLAFYGNYNKLVELVNQSRIASETARITELDKLEDDLLTYFFSTIKTGANHPNPTKREAAQALQNVVKPYFGVQSLPQRQQVQAVDGLLMDLKKSENIAHITALGMTEDLVYFEELNGEYRELIDSRAASQMANPAESVKSIREEMYVQYDTIVTTIFAFSIATPSDVLTAFITKVNKLIADTNQAYNQRMAERSKSTEENKA